MEVSMASRLASFRTIYHLTGAQGYPPLVEKLSTHFTSKKNLFLHRYTYVYLPRAILTALFDVQVSKTYHNGNFDGHCDRFELRIQRKHIRVNLSICLVTTTS